MNKKNLNTQSISLLLIISIVSIGLFSGFLVNHNTLKTHSKLGDIITKDTSNIILIKNLAFVPDIKTVKVNTTITWINKDVAIHNVHSGTPEIPTPMIVSSNLSKDQKFSYKFTKKGIYKYYCTIHSSIMQATIVVK